MAITTTAEYVNFFIDLNMGKDVSLLSFVNNERMVLKQKLGHKNLDKEQIKKGINILEGLIKDIDGIGESQILKRYQKYPMGEEQQDG